MSVIDNAQLRNFSLPGLNHQTLAGHAQGVQSMEVWQQKVAAHAETPVHCHACEEVIVILTGSGEITIDGATTEFGPNSTIVVPPDVVHQLINTCDDEIHLVSALGMAPVRVKTADGEAMPIPWEAPDLDE